MTSNLPAICRLIFSSLLLIAFTTTKAQTIKGKITDAASGEPLTGATIEIEHNTKELTKGAGLDGSFAFRNLQPGQYEVKVKMVGYKAYKNEPVTVAASGEVVLNLRLEQERTDLQSVVVTAGSRGTTDNSARRIEKISPTVVNVLSEKAIQLSPDVTVANSLQRISGVTIERSSAGEGRYAIIRGMDQRYNTTLVNGIKIPSPDDRYRYIPMDIFPSDLLERLEVIKSLTPNMEGDAIGGTMNLVMKSAPDKLLFTAFAAGGSSTLFNSRPFATFDRGSISKSDPYERNGSNYMATTQDFTRSNLNFTDRNNPVNSQLGFTIGNRFLRKKLGVVLGASYQNMFRGSDNVFLRQNAQPNVAPVDNYPAFDDAFVRRYSTQQRRFGINNKWDFAMNSRHKISLFNMYLHMDEMQSRYTVDSSLAIQRQGPGNGNVAILNRSRWQIQDVYNSTLQGEHILSKYFTAKWSAVYSLAKQNVPDQAEYSVVHQVSVDSTGKSAETYSKPSDVERIWRHNKDEDLSGYLNLITTPTIASHKVELSTGGLYRHKTRENYYNNYLLSAVNANDTFYNINTANYGFRTTDGGKGNPVNSNSYTSTEQIASGYLQAKFDVGKLQVTGGVRVEHTDQHYETKAPITENARYGKIWYTDVLPSVNLKYGLSITQNLRAAFYKAISRPGFFEITPYNFVNEFYTERGNPELKHTQSDNYDLRYEWFPGGADQILLGSFYKRIYNPIEYALLRTGTKQYLSPANFGTATNYGFEAQVTKYFGKIGFSANYTYTKSSITTTKAYYYRNTANSQLETKYVEQTRPLQGQANHIGNVALLFKDSKTGIDIQAAFVYTGERLIQVSPYFGLDNWQRPYNQLDFSFEKRLAKRLFFYGKLTNLTNSQSKVVVKQPNLLLSGSNQIPFQDSPDYIFVQRDIYKLTYLFGLRYKM